MSIATEIQRIQGAKESIKSSIESKGVTVPSDAKLDDYPSYIDSIQGGGGGSCTAEGLKKFELGYLGEIKGDVEFDDTVETITKEYLFDSFSGITSISGDALKTYNGGYAFNACTSLSDISFPNLETIGGQYFCYNCSGLTTVNLPKVSTISGGTPFYKSSLETISLPSIVELKAAYVFRNSTKLSEIRLGSSLQTLSGSSAFDGCTALQTIYIEAINPPKLGSSTYFSGAKNLKTIYVPCESVDAYIAAQYWSAASISSKIVGYNFIDNTTDCSGGGGGGGDLTDFIFNYNAKDYDSSTKTIAKTDGQTLNIDAVFTKGTPTFRTDNLVVSGSEVNLNPDGSNASLFNWNASSPNMTFVFKGVGATSGNDGVLYSNAWSGRNFYLSLFNTSIRLRGDGNDITISNSVNNSPNILSVTIEGLAYKVKNHTTNQEWSGSLNGYGQDQTKGGALFYNIMTSNYFNGIFYWIYMAKRVLSDDEIQDVITFNE